MSDVSERTWIVEGDYVKTVKGANYCGVVDVVFNTRDGTPHAVVEAIDPKFERSCHVYPVLQLARVV